MRDRRPARSTRPWIWAGPSSSGRLPKPTENSRNWSLGDGVEECFGSVAHFDGRLLFDGLAELHLKYYSRGCCYLRCGQAAGYALQFPPRNRRMTDQPPPSNAKFINWSINRSRHFDNRPG